MILEEFKGLFPDAHQVQLFNSRIDVESYSAKSSQAVVFFGREKTLGIRVVCKQYTQHKKHSILSEIKVFTLLESLRQQCNGKEMVNLLNKNKELAGFPLMIGYKIRQDCSEILMTHGGSTLAQWYRFIENRQKRIDFAADFLRQSIAALKTLHSVGYAHGDLKSENVCARQTKDGGYKFTLIDFGICTKLSDAHDVERGAHFRGNLMNCSTRQLLFQKPTRVCDLQALLQIAYYLIYGVVPSTVAARALVLSKPDIFSPAVFSQFRYQHRRQFEKELCSKRNPFASLASCIIRMQNHPETTYGMKQIDAMKSEIDYDFLVSLVPE